MAKKKSKEQLKEERRRAMERKRRETGWEPPPEPDMEQERLMADMAPLVIDLDDRAGPEQPAVANFIAMILDSDNLIEEPEFDDVYVHPIYCVQAFADAIEDLGLEDIDPETLPRDEDVQGELMATTALNVLTDDAKEAIFTALENVRDRARQDGDTDLMAQAAGVYGFLEEVAVDEVWANIGVVQAVITRSMAAGIEMSQIIEEEAERAATGKGRPRLLRRIVGDTLEQKMERILDKYPGLAEFMAEQAEDDWEAGAEALSSGELYLGLFTEDEISAAFDGVRAVGLELDEDGDLVPGEGAGDDVGDAFVRRLQSYVDALATPERLTQMQARVDELATAADPSLLTFLSLLSDAFERQDEPEHVHRLLVHALVGEMHASGREAEEQG